MQRRIYIAAPFFNDAQLHQVQLVEKMLIELHAPFHSPRSTGVLIEMAQAERERAAPKIFNSNVEEMCACTAIVALLDDKDTGTTWELGFGYALKRLLPQYKLLGVQLNGKPCNVMLQESFDAVAFDVTSLNVMLYDWRHGNVMLKHYGISPVGVY